MKTRWLIIAVVLLPTLGLTGGISVRNPAIRNPVGIGTAPVSSYHNGMVTTGIPVDATANPGIAGNLHDGQDSHGNVPYRSASVFRTGRSSSSISPPYGAPLLNSFLRNSAGHGALGSRSGTDYARPYLSPTEAVARTVPGGRKGVVTPQNIDSRYGVFQRDSSVANNLYPMETTAKPHVTAGQGKTTYAAGFHQPQKQSRRPLLDHRGASRLEDRNAFVGEGADRSQLGESAPSGENVKDATTDKIGRYCMDGSGPSLETTGKQNAIQSQTESGQKYSEALGRIKQQLDALSRSIESRLQTAPGFEQEPRRLGDSENVRRTRSEIPNPAPKARGLNDPVLADSSYRLKVREPVSREAKRTIGGQQNRNSLAAHKFSRHLQDAEDYLRAGEYYKAADSFTQALVYSRDNPQALAGKSHALFAAGEYMSSAMLLTRALAINPSYAKVRVDFVALLGGPNKLARRVGDIERWSARSGSPQLQLLLGYVYYRTGRLSEAKRAIKAAGAKMPESPAVGAIIAAISDAQLDQ